MSGASWLWIGSLTAGLAVGVGAFGAHGLKQRLAEGADGDFQPREIFETGARYHMYHGLAILAVGFASIHFPQQRGLSIAGWSFLLGAPLFSGSLYILALTTVKAWGAVAPFGGLAFLFGWAALAITFWRVSRVAVFPEPVAVTS